MKKIRILLIVYLLVWLGAFAVTQRMCLSYKFPHAHVSALLEPYCSKTIKGSEYIFPLRDVQRMQMIGDQEWHRG